MNNPLGALLLLPAALVAALPQSAQEPKPQVSQPEVTVILQDEPDAEGKPRKITFTAEQIQWLQGDPALIGVSGMRIINGALYQVVGGRLLPIPGGGASGCFDATGEATKAKIAAAQAELIKQITATSAPTPEKK